MCISSNVLLQSHIDVNMNKPPETRGGGGATFPANKQLDVEIKCRVRECQETPACGDVCAYMYPRRAHGSTVAACSLLGRVLHSGPSIPGVLFCCLHEWTKKYGKGSVERFARAWPFVSNQTHSAGSSSIRGLCLLLPTRQRLVQTRALGDKPLLNPAIRRCWVRSALLKQAACFSSPTHSLFSPSLLSSVQPQKWNRLLPSPALYRPASSPVKWERRGLIWSVRSQRLCILKSPFTETWQNC